jgi:DNA-binding winged helix-turn-helix (wHTH) protein
MMDGSGGRYNPTSRPEHPMASGEPIPPDVELDLARYELRRGGRVERLEKLPMELLTFLAERRGQLVTRAEILERLWGKDVFVDADAAINTAVRKVRRALADDPDRPQFLETVVGKGYRFVGPITVIPGAETTPSAPDGARGSRLPGQMGAAMISRRSVSSWWALGIASSPWPCSPSPSWPGSAASAPAAGRPWSPSPSCPSRTRAATRKPNT